MAGNLPRILVIADDRREGVLIASMLQEAGFVAVVAVDAPGALAALTREHIAAAVVGCGDDGVEIVRAIRRRRPGLPAVLVLAPSALPPIGDDFAAILKRPLDLRQLLDRVLDLVLSDGDGQRAALRCDVAEFGIAAAKLACLNNRYSSAAAVGASRLARDLARQIGETAALRSGFAATIAGFPGQTLPAIA